METQKHRNTKERLVILLQCVSSQSLPVCKMDTNCVHSILHLLLNVTYTLDVRCCVTAPSSVWNIALYWERCCHLPRAQVGSILTGVKRLVMTWREQRVFCSQDSNPQLASGGYGNVAEFISASTNRLWYKTNKQTNCTDCGNLQLVV